MHSTEFVVVMSAVNLRMCQVRKLDDVKSGKQGLCRGVMNAFVVRRSFTQWDFQIMETFALFVGFVSEWIVVAPF